MAERVASKERAKAQQEMRLRVLLMRQQKNKSLKKENHLSLPLYTDKEVGLDQAFLLENVVEAVNYNLSSN